MSPILQGNKSYQTLYSNCDYTSNYHYGWVKFHFSNQITHMVQIGI